MCVGVCVRLCSGYVRMCVVSMWVEMDERVGLVDSVRIGMCVHIHDVLWKGKNV